MAWIETLCIECDKPHLTDLDTLTNDFIRKSALSYVGTTWRYCKEHSPAGGLDLKLELEDSARFQQFVKHPDEKADLLKRLEPDDIIDCKAEATAIFDKMKYEIGLWEGIRWRQSEDG